MKTRAMLIVCTLLVAMVMSAFPVQQKTAVAVSVRYGGRLTVAVGESFPGFCIANNPGMTDLSANRAIYETLFERQADGSYGGLLAQSISHSPDLRTWTVGLRTGIKFTDGTDFDSSAVVKNFDWMRGVKYLEDQTKYNFTVGVVSLFLANIANVTASNSTTVVFTLDRPNALFVENLSLGGRLFMRSPVQLSNDTTRTTCSNNPVGTGPFVLRSFSSTEIVLDRNSNYWRTDNQGNRLPYLDGVTYTYVGPDLASTRAQMVRIGSADVATFLSMGEATQIRDLRNRNQEVNEYRTRRAFIKNVWFNQGKAGSKFATLQARKAAAHSIDAADYRSSVGRGEMSALPHESTSAPGMMAAPGIDFNLSKSATAHAAYKTESGLSSLSFNFPASTTAGSQNAARNLTDRWESASLVPTLNVMESALLIANLYNTGGNKFDIADATLYSDDSVTVATYLLSNAFPSDSTNPVAATLRSSVGRIVNLSLHSSTAVDGAVYAALGETDPALRQEKFAAVAAAVDQEVLQVPLGMGYASYVTTKHIDGVWSSDVVPGPGRAPGDAAGPDLATIYKTSAVVSTPTEQNFWAGTSRVFGGSPIDALSGDTDGTVAFGVNANDRVIHAFDLDGATPLQASFAPTGLPDGRSTVFGGIGLDPTSAVLYLSDRANGKVLKVSVSDHSTSILAVTGGAPSDTVVAADGTNLFVRLANSPQIVRINASTGAVSRSGVLGSNNLAILGQRPGQFLWLLDQDSRDVLKVSTTSLEVVSSLRLAFPATFGAVWATGVLASLFDGDSGGFRRVDLVSGESGDPISLGQDPTAVLEIENGNLVVAENSEHVVVKVPVPALVWDQSRIAEKSRVIRTHIRSDVEVFDFGAGDFTNSGTADGCIFAPAKNPEDSLRLDVTVSCGSDGTVVPRLLAASVVDGFGRPGPSSGVEGPTHVMDTLAPSAMWGSPSGKIANLEVTYTLTFAEAISGLSSGDLANNGNAPGCVFGVSGSGADYRVTITCGGFGTVRPVLLDSTVFDGVGNAGPTANVKGSAFEMVEPTTSATPSTGNSEGSSTVVPPAVSSTTSSTSSGGFKTVAASKPPAQVASAMRVSRSGSKIAVEIRVPAVTTSTTRVVRYLFELRPIKPGKIVAKSVLVKAGRTVSGVISGKAGTSYRLYVTAIQKSGKRFPWKGPSIRLV